MSQLEAKCEMSYEKIKTNTVNALKKALLSHIYISLYFVVVCICIFYVYTYESLLNNIYILNYFLFQQQKYIYISKDVFRWVIQTKRLESEQRKNKKSRNCFAYVDLICINKNSFLAGPPLMY